MSDTTHNLNESADKIRLETQVKRGDGTRDEDRMKVKVRGDDPDDSAKRMADTLAALEHYGIADTLRETQPDE